MRDLTALKKLYESHADDCARAAELTVDPRGRELYLKLARDWAEAAAALDASKDPTVAENERAISSQS